jgi:hypothetical protein
MQEQEKNFLLSNNTIIKLIFIFFLYQSAFRGTKKSNNFKNNKVNFYFKPNNFHFGNFPDILFKNKNKKKVLAIRSFHDFFFFNKQVNLKKKPYITTIYNKFLKKHYFKKFKKKVNFWSFFERKRLLMQKKKKIKKFLKIYNVKELKLIESFMVKENLFLNSPSSFKKLNFFKKYIEREMNIKSLLLLKNFLAKQIYVRIKNYKHLSPDFKNFKDASFFSFCLFLLFKRELIFFKKKMDHLTPKR